MADSPNSNMGRLVTFAVYSNGKKVSDSYQFRSIEVHREINRIGSAFLKVIAGDMPHANVPESESNDFKPGQQIKIELGYESTDRQVFEGIVVSQKISIPGNENTSPVLVVECRDEAIKATVARKNRVFEDKKDNEAVSAALGDCGLSVSMDDTKIVHTKLVQYYCTDWDFALSRADVYGMLVTTDGAKVTIQKPKAGAGPVLTVKYGTDLLSFDGEVYAEDQFTTVESVGWNPVDQKAVSASSSPASLNSQGNLTPGNLSSAAGTDTVTLQTDSLWDAGVLKEWADSTLLKTGLSRFRGSFSFCGNAAAVPGCIIELQGLGARFNGNAFAGAVTHRVADGSWITEVEMGISPMNITQQPDVVAPPASGLYPGIEGLHIGIVEALAGDPDSGSRIKVQIPLLNTKPDTIWARLSQFAASNGVGSFFIPSVGDEVILGFVNNDPNNAIILGCLYSAKHVLPYEITDDNYKRAFISPQKLKIELDDEKKVITIITPGKNSVVIDDDSKTITLKDQNKNEIVMGEKGIQLISDKDITLNAKGNISMEAKGKVGIKATQDATVEGMNVTVKAQTSLKLSGSASAELSASGQTTVKGAMVMIN